ncbi:MAG: helix-turn-helix transcriptional regulator [Flavobacterium sp.]
MIGEKIRKIRILKGYSQQYVSDLLGVSQGAYSDIETGKTKMNLDKLKEIAAIFNLDIFHIVDFHENKILKQKFYDLNKQEDEIRKRIDKERELYKEQIDNLKSEIMYLRNKLNEK